MNTVLKCVPVSDGIHWEGCLLHTFLTNTCQTDASHAFVPLLHTTFLSFAIWFSYIYLWEFLTVGIKLLSYQWSYRHGTLIITLNDSMIASSSSVHLGTIMSWFLRPCYDKRNWTLLPCSFMGDWWTSLSAVLSCKFLWVQFCRGAVQNRTKFQ